MGSPTYAIHRRARPHPTVELWQVRPTTATDPDSLAFTPSFVLESIREAHGPDGPPEGHPLHGMPAYDTSWHETHDESLLPRVELVGQLQKVRRGAGWPSGTDGWVDEARAMSPAAAERFLAEKLNTYVLAIEAATPALFEGLAEVLESHAYDVTAVTRARSSGLHPSMIEGWVASEALSSTRQRRLDGTHFAAAFGNELVSASTHSDSHRLHRWSRTFEPIGIETLRKKTAQLVGLATTNEGVYTAYSTEVVFWTPDGVEALTKKSGHFSGKVQGLVPDGDGVWAFGTKEAVRLVGTQVDRRVPAPAKTRIGRLLVAGNELIIRDTKKLVRVRGEEVTTHRVASGFDLVRTSNGDLLLGEQWLPSGASEVEPLALPEGWGPVMASVAIGGREWLVFRGGAATEWNEGLGEARPFGALPHFVRGAFAWDGALIAHGSHLVEWDPRG
jgi:hypothetical protein